MLQEDNGVLKATAKVTIENTSELDGAEVVQIYVSKKESCYARPVKKLCAFERIEIPAGKTAEVKLDIDKHYLECFDNGDFVLEEGLYTFGIGSDSIDLEYKEINIK